jgi:hypothetical protein
VRGHSPFIVVVGDAERGAAPSAAAGAPGGYPVVPRSAGPRRRLISIMLKRPRPITATKLQKRPIEPTP